GGGGGVVTMAGGGADEGMVITTGVSSTPYMAYSGSAPCPGHQCTCTRRPKQAGHSCSTGRHTAAMPCSTALASCLCPLSKASRPLVSVRSMRESNVSTHAPLWLQRPGCCPGGGRRGRTARADAGCRRLQAVDTY